MGLGLPTSSTKRNDPTIGNPHLGAPLGQGRVEGAGVRTMTPVVIGSTSKDWAAAADGDVTVLGWALRKAEGDMGTSWDADWDEDTLIAVEAGYGVIRQATLEANQAVTPDDYLCASGLHLLRLWVDGVDDEGAKLARPMQSSNVAADALIAIFCLR